MYEHKARSNHRKNSGGGWAEKVKDWRVIIFAVLWASQTTVVVISLICYHSFFTKLSHWFYLIVDVFYFFCAGGYFYPALAKCAAAMTFFMHGSNSMWFVLTLMLIVVNPGILLNDRLLEEGVMGWWILGMFYLHFSPMFFSLMYAGQNRDEIARFFGRISQSTSARWGIWMTYSHGLFQVFSPLLLVAIYLVMFDPFVQYNITYNYSILVMGLVIAFFICSTSNISMSFYLSKFVN